MLAHVSTAATLIYFLLHILVASSELVVRKLATVKPSGFRCGTRIFTKETLSAATRDARNNLDNVGAAPEGSTGSFSKLHKESSRIVWNDGRNLMWPLMDPARQLKSNEKVPQVYFVVIRGALPEELEPIDVVEKRIDNKFRRCIWEPDLSDMWGRLIVSGFRCPTDVFPREAIKMSMDMLKANFKKDKTAMKKYPMDFDGRPLFHTTEPLFLWPITKSEKRHYQVLISIVVDKDKNFVGIVHQIRHVYLRCRVTSIDLFAPRLLQSNILTEFNRVEPGELGVFKCGLNIISFITALRGTLGAIEGFRDQRCELDKQYPYLFAEDSVEGTDSERYFLWPVNVDGSSPYLPDSKEFKSSFDSFLVIDDFSDIVGVVYKPSHSSDYKECKWGTVRGDWYQKYLAM